MDLNESGHRFDIGVGERYEAKCSLESVVQLR